MRSSFFEFTVANTALHVARGGLETVSHNVANANTPGYSRQYIMQRASTPITFYNGRGMIGTGAEIYGIGQMRSNYLDTKYWTESSVLGEYAVKQTQLSLTETIFASLSSTGLNSIYDKFFSTISDLSTNSGDATYRTNVIQSAASVASDINTLVESLKKQQTDINAEVKSVVTIMNSLAYQIRSLNEQISKFELDGSRANDLRDQRTRLVDQLSQYVNVEVKEEEFDVKTATGNYTDKRFSVLINGEEFVNHYQVFPMDVQKRQEKLNPYDVAGLYDVYFTGSGKQFNLHSSTLEGELKGLIDIRDGNNSVYFSTTSASKVSVISGDEPDSPATTIRITNPNKTDINSTGYIAFTDPKTGKQVEMIYTDIVKNADGSMDITVPKPPGVPVFVETAAVTIGETTEYKGIPHYIEKLNQMVRTLAKAFNEGIDRNGDQIPDVTGHANGYNQSGETGILFFTYDGSKTTLGGGFDYDLLTAENFMVNPDLLSNPAKMATNKTSVLDESENDLALEFLNINSFRGLFAEGKLSDFLIGMAGELGIDVKQAENFTINYTDVVTTIDNQRISYSGVDVNEEMISLVRYQQLYQAAAKLINVIDGVYDTMINRLGV